MPRPPASPRDPLPWQRTCEEGKLVVALVRHGQTAWNRERRFLGSTDLPLDEVGQAQARALADRIGRPFHRVYTSPLARARQTALALHDDPTEIAAVRELSQGDLEGLCFEEAARRFPDFLERWNTDPGRTCVPGGESLGACQARAWEALTELADRHAPGEAVAVVTHQLVIASLTCAALGCDLRAWRQHGVGNTRITALAREADGGWTVVTRGWPQVDPQG